MLKYNNSYFDKECLKNIEDHFKNNISYIKKCEDFLKKKYNFEHVILTTSCTHSLEMMAMILDIGNGDEVIVPSYTFVSTANAFVKFGAKIKLIDSCEENPNIDLDKIEESITEKTKALVVVHYGGWSPDMNRLKKICKDKNIYLLEDAAQAIDCYYDSKPSGSFGILSAFSFHNTKNIHCGEGGLLVINDKKLISKARIILDKGTNRYDFTNKKVDKYEWLNLGSSYTLSEINAAFLFQQIINMNSIINKRKKIWKLYEKELKFIEEKGLGKLSKEEVMCKGNYHIFYIVFNSATLLKNLKEYLFEKKIETSTHYIPLQKSKYYRENYKKISLINSEKYGERLLRFPNFYEIRDEDIIKISSLLKKYFID